LQPFSEEEGEEEMRTMKPFSYPPLFEFPPLFTLQPVIETRKRQLQIWTELTLDFFRHHNIFTFNLTDLSSSTSPTPSPSSSSSSSSHLVATQLFSNPRINRRLSYEGVFEIFKLLVATNRAEWQNKEKTRVLILQQSAEEWGWLIYKWANENGLTDTVCTFFDIQQGNTFSPYRSHSFSFWFSLFTLFTPPLPFILVASSFPHSLTSFLASALFHFFSLHTLFFLFEGEQAEGQKFFNIDTQVLIKSLKFLETQGKAHILVGSDGEGMGVKFFS
jgi:ESCRT-II complex subunit VPS25